MVTSNLDLKTCFCMTWSRDVTWPRDMNHLFTGIYFFVSVYTSHAQTLITWTSGTCVGSWELQTLSSKWRSWSSKRLLRSFHLASLLIKIRCVKNMQWNVRAGWDSCVPTLVWYNNFSHFPCSTVLPSPQLHVGEVGGKGGGCNFFNCLNFL